MKPKNTSWNYERAKELADASGLKRWKIAEEIGIEETTLTQILGGRNTSLPIIKLLAQVLGCEESELTGDTEQAS